MSDLQSKIDALPEWPDMERWGWASHEIETAALARLALAREWIEANPHTNPCPWRGLLKNAAGYIPPCACGRDALLKALEEPK